VDDFAATYPGCTELSSALLLVPSTDITNLNGLNTLSSIAGVLQEGVLHAAASTEISAKLYPNPTSGQAFIEFNRVPENAEIVVMMFSAES
jgi:hypothetical protein